MTRSKYTLPDPSELSDEEVDRIMNSAPVQEVLERIKKSRLDEIAKMTGLPVQEIENL